MLRLRVPSQPTLRPFDVAVALRLLLEPEDRYEPLAEALATSTSAVHRGVARLQSAGLAARGTRTVARPALREFLLHGVRYAFPPVRGQEVVGLPTAWSSRAGGGPAPAGTPAGDRRGRSCGPMTRGRTAVSCWCRCSHPRSAWRAPIRACTSCWRPWMRCVPARRPFAGS